eukprot:4030623-Prymnesium_polylepis.1
MPMPMSICPCPHVHAPMSMSMSPSPCPCPRDAHATPTRCAGDAHVLAERRRGRPRRTWQGRHRLAARAVRAVHSRADAPDGLSPRQVVDREEC